MAEHLFTSEEANRLLPEVEGIVVRLKEGRGRLEEVHGGLGVFTTRSRMNGTGHVSHEIGHLKQELTRLNDALSVDLRRLDELGCVLKDLDRGLVDFPTLLEGREVYLCWQLGETRISFYHETHEGFAARKPYRTV